MRKKLAFRAVTALALLGSSAACGNSDPAVEKRSDTGTDTGATIHDTQVTPDTNVLPDTSVDSSVELDTGAAPDSTAPDSTAPDSTAPDSTAPDSTVPDSTVPDTSPVVDTGAFDALGDAIGDAVVDSGPKDAVADVVTVVTDKTTGHACTTTDDCNVTGDGVSYCTNASIYAIGPLDPTPVCTQFSASVNVCDPGPLDATGNQTTLMLCDNGQGLCSETPSGGVAGKSVCEPFCRMDDTGAWITRCLGKNACSPSSLIADATTGRNELYGNCFGGCSSNADCPTASVCDPVEKLCVGVKCTSNASCTSAWTGAPAAWKCDLTAGSATNGYCSFQYAKKVGDLCDPSKTSNQDCLCFNGATATQGVCTALCTTGRAGDCPTGFVCDPLLNTVDAAGKQIYAATFAVPAGVSAYCAATCVADTDCKAGQKCTVHAGMGVQKTCSM
jgi:hypothetical protein